MKTSFKSTLLGALVIGANSLMAAPASNDGFEQWYKAKYGANSLIEESRLKAERANIAHREEATPKIAPANTWFESFYRAKYGRSSPMEEARMKPERESAAFRNAVTPKAAMPANARRNEFWKAKYGHPFPGDTVTLHMTVPPNGKKLISASDVTAPSGKDK